MISGGIEMNWLNFEILEMKSGDDPSAKLLASFYEVFQNNFLIEYIFSEEKN